MEIVVVETSDEVGQLAAELVADVITQTPTAVLGLATGSSPLGIYAALAKRVAAGELDFSRASGFALDEYVGIPLDHPQSYASVIADEVVGPLGMRPELVRVPDGLSTDLDAAAREYDEAIRAAGGIHIQILGIGANGHIGFNEPTSSLASRTRVKTLAPSTIADNARFFKTQGEVPLHCVTQGLGTILEARRIVLVAQGTNKARAIAEALEGPVSSLWPGSVLQHHPYVTVIVDADAASNLQLVDYYRHTWANKRQVQS